MASSSSASSTSSNQHPTPPRSSTRHHDQGRRNNNNNNNKRRSSPAATRRQQQQQQQHRISVAPPASVPPASRVRILVPLPRDDESSLRHSSQQHQPLSLNLPTVLRFLFYAYVFNIIWLVAFSSHHLDHHRAHQAFPGDNRVLRTAGGGQQYPPDDDESVLVVIVSDRLSGIIPTVSSILTNTKSRSVDLVLIGEHHGLNEQVERHFQQASTTSGSSEDSSSNTTTTTTQNKKKEKKDRLHAFTSLTVKDIQNDLLQQGYDPIWTWPEWGSSRKPGWHNDEYTLHVADWDELETHAHELNHLRFYLPLVSQFRHKKYLYFLDDDILVQKDLGHVADAVLPDLPETKGLLTPCNIWLWDEHCHFFDFKNEKTISTILEMPSLYGDRHVCETDAEPHCYPPSYKDFLSRNLPDDIPGAAKQKAWNFGFSLFALDHWRQLELTKKYERIMKESYKYHVFPETSLTFGLGVSYLAFAGAVECWNDDSMKVRDGFGFIEWERYAKTFGGDSFFDAVDVVHYTGPHKPWVDNATIDARSLQPWIDYMAEEGMGIPDQLPTEPTQKLFMLLASERTGANWILNHLDSHDRVCASGETTKPETGFPTEVLHPEDLPWLPVCSTKRGCSLAFVREEVLRLHNTMDVEKRGRTGIVPARCQPQHLRFFQQDPLGEHLPRICNFVQELRGNFTDANIATVWVQAFQNEDRDLLGCSCSRGAEVKGVKVYTDWLTYENFPYERLGPPAMVLDDSAFHGSKIVRLKRRNLWARYKSELMAIESSMYHLTTPEEKMEQFNKVESVTVSIEEMMRKLQIFASNDEAGDDWAAAHGLEVLHVDYADCRKDASLCFRRIFEFLHVDPNLANVNHVESSFAEFDSMDISLAKIANQGAVREALCVNGYAAFLNITDYSEVQLLVYDDSELFDQEHHFHHEKGINATMFGREKSSLSSSSKYANAISFLKDMAPDTLVVLSVTRDVRIRFPPGSDFSRYQAIHEFRTTIEELTRAHPGSVVVSTESHCCASALTHASPGDFFGPNGQRKNRSCISGEAGCEWAGDDKVQPWQTFMQDASKQQQTSGDIYLDASLVAGRAIDLIEFILATDISEEEDDRAVLADFMFNFPERIILDYGKRLFGANREGLHSETNKQCPFRDDVAVAKSRLLHIATSCLFMDNPRGLGCVSEERFTRDKEIAFPRWDQRGIKIGPILDHIDRVASKNCTLVLPYGKEVDDRQGPEIPYFVDEHAIWTSKNIRDRTDNHTLQWRTTPTESLMRMAHKILRSGGMEADSRWRAVTKKLHSGGFPHWAWYGDFKTCNYHNYYNDSIPIFTPSVLANCDHAFPVPNYMNAIDSQPTSDNWRGLLRDTKAMFPWESKLRKVVWRGALSEADGKTVLQSVRWRLNKYVHELNRKDIYDVGLTSIPFWVEKAVNRNVSEVGGLIEEITPMTKFMKYMAILDMDGNSWSSRYATLLCYNSVVIKVEPKYLEYFQSNLKPWTHYIPVKDDLSDLHEIVQWALDPQNADTVQDIVAEANEWCSQHLIPQELAHDLLDTWESYVRLLDQANPHWQQQWLAKKSAILSSTSELDLFRLKSPKQKQGALSEL